MGKAGSLGEAVGEGSVCSHEWQGAVSGWCVRVRGRGWRLGRVSREGRRPRGVSQEGWRAGRTGSVWVRGEGRGARWAGGGGTRRPARTWKRLMMSASVASRSTTLPLPSSPHCAPSTTVTREPVVAASCCSRPRLTPPAAGGRSLEARVPDMPAQLFRCAGPPESPPHQGAAPLKGTGRGRGAGPGAGSRAP